MDFAKMNNLRVAAFSSLTLLKNYRRSLLEDAIRNNPTIFVRYVIEYKLKPRQQAELMTFFLSLAIKNNRLNENYRHHLNLFFHNYTSTSLWPNSVSLFRTSITSLGVILPDPALY